MRLNKLLARAGVASRRKAELLIIGNRVKVNGTVVAEPFARVNPGDEITVDGVRLPKPEKKAYFLLNKPVGFLSTVTDPHGRKTVMDLLPSREMRLYPVGRLDADTEGLLLVTNDGELAYRLTHPRFQVPRTYRALVRGVPAANEIRQLKSGVKIEGNLTAPAEVRLRKKEGTLGSWLEITIHEGRNRQVRNMCAVIGHPVVRLCRTGFAQLKIQGLRTGRHRRLTGAEIDGLYQIVGLERE